VALWVPFCLIFTILFCDHKTLTMRIRLSWHSIWFIRLFYSFHNLFFGFPTFRPAYQWRDLIIWKAHLVHLNWYRIIIFFLHSNVKQIRYQFWCTRCAFRLLKSRQWYLGRKKSWKSENSGKEPKIPNTVPWNWTKSVEG
jgi:hypothetical protein